MRGWAAVHNSLANVSADTAEVRSSRAESSALNESSKRLLYSAALNWIPPLASPMLMPKRWLDQESLDHPSTASSTFFSATTSVPKAGHPSGN
jgi:hypothetical protein